MPIALAHRPRRLRRPAGALTFVAAALIAGCSNGPDAPSSVASGSAVSVTDVATVSLRAHAQDADGNSVTQTVTDAYRTSAAP